MAEVEEPRLSLRKKTRTALFDPSACSQTPQMLHVVSAKKQSSSPPPPPPPANNKQTKATNADAAGQKRGRKEEEVQKKEKKGDVKVRFRYSPSDRYIFYIFHSLQLTNNHSFIRHQQRRKEGDRPTQNVRLRPNNLRKLLKKIKKPSTSTSQRHSTTPL